MLFSLITEGFFFFFFVPSPKFFSLVRVSLTSLTVFLNIEIYEVA